MVSEIQNIKRDYKVGGLRYVLFSILTYPLRYTSLKKVRTDLKWRILGTKIIPQIQKKFGLKFINKVLFCYPSSLREIFIDGVYDFFKINEKDIIFDLGATCGEYGLYCSRFGARTYSFEMSKESFEIMKKTINKNHAQGEVFPFLERIDDKNSIDRFSRQLNVKPTLLKIDIEGDEYKALVGASETLKLKPRIILETHSKELEKKCIDFLKRRGYFVLSETKINNQIYSWFLESKK